MDLKEANGKVTGTAGPNSGKQWSLHDGKLDGPKLPFALTGEDGEAMEFDLTFDGQEIRGDCKGSGPNGEKISAKLALKPVS